MWHYGEIMNHIMETVIVGAMILTGLYVTFDYAQKHLDITFTSYHDIIELEKNKAGEMLKIIEIFHNPLMADVLNIGESDIIIKKMFVDGIVDETFSINGENTNVIPLKIITTIIPTNSNGKTMKIITEYKNEFEFN